MWFDSSLTARFHSFALVMLPVSLIIDKFLNDALANPAGCGRETVLSTGPAALAVKW
jgi:hypothetical protein